MNLRHTERANDRVGIVIVDAATTNPGDLDWNELRQLGELSVFDNSLPEQVIERCTDAPVVLTNKVVLDRKVLEALPKLRFISVLASGTNVVDLETATKRGVVVSNVPGYSTASVAEHVFALLFALNNRVAEHRAAAEDGRWRDSGQFSYRLGPIRELRGLTFGIVGLGAIGASVAAIASAFGMRVVALERERRRVSATNEAPAVERLPLKELLETSDILSLHCPLTDATRGLINAERLSWMKPTSLLINTGRGPLIDEPALARALQGRQISGAALDVLSVEPPPADHPLLGLPNCIITPHLAWASVQARSRLIAISSENVRAFLRGKPQNVVNLG